VQGHACIGRLHGRPHALRCTAGCACWLGTGSMDQNPSATPARSARQQALLPAASRQHAIPFMLLLPQLLQGMGRVLGPPPQAGRVPEPSGAAAAMSRATAFTLPNSLCSR
jgi:hypothetical protein